MGFKGMEASGSVRRMGGFLQIHWRQSSYSENTQVQGWIPQYLRILVFMVCFNPTCMSLRWFCRTGDGKYTSFTKSQEHGVLTAAACN